MSQLKITSNQIYVLLQSRVINTLYLQSLYNRRCIWNLVKRQWAFFAETVNLLRTLAIFAEDLSRGCFTGY